MIDADEYIGVKSFKAKGKRVSNFTIDSVTEIAPREVPEEEDQSAATVAEMDNTDTDATLSDAINQQEVRDQLTGQTRLFGEGDE